jgi:hypothetical protein
VVVGDTTDGRREEWFAEYPSFLPETWWSL